MILNVLSPARIRMDRVLGLAVVTPALFAAGMLYPRAAAYLSRPRGARMFSDQVQKETELAGRRIGGNCALLAPPQYVETEVPGGNVSRKRHTWQVAASCGDRNVYFIFNDVNGRIVQIRDVGPAARSGQPELKQVAVKTDAEAAEIAMHFLTDASIVPAGSEVSFAPHSAVGADESYWWVTWNVRDTSKSASYAVKSLVRRQDGCVMDALDTRELNTVSPQ